MLVQNFKSTGRKITLADPSYVKVSRKCLIQLHFAQNKSLKFSHITFITHTYLSPIRLIKKVLSYHNNKFYSPQDTQEQSVELFHRFHFNN